MSYVDAHLDRDYNKIHVVERVNGKREYKDFPANYVFYYNEFPLYFCVQLNPFCFNSLHSSDEG